jgi:hypothetical protein
LSVINILNLAGGCLPYNVGVGTERTLKSFKKFHPANFDQIFIVKKITVNKNKNLWAILIFIFLDNHKNYLLFAYLIFL